MVMALEGIKILDLSQHLPGNYVTHLLGDLGADVLKVEQPDRNRPGGSSDPLTPNSAVLNRNKRSIALNLKYPEAREVFYALVADADVVLEGYRPGVAERLGVNYEHLRELNPRIIYCAISGYGQDGPYRLHPGHDANYIALAGVLGLAKRTADGVPAIPPVNVGDFGGGTMFACIGILSAIIARQMTGRGQFVDISMVDGTLSWLGARDAAAFLAGGSEDRAERPQYNVYECKDGGFFSLGILEPWFWERWCNYLGRPDFHPLTPELSPQVLEHHRQLFKTRTRDEWTRIFEELEVEGAPVLSPQEAFSHPQVLHRKMVVEAPRPGEGKVKQVGLPVKLSDTPGGIRGPAPRLGEHTDEVLRDLGYSNERIAALRATGAIKSG